MTTITYYKSASGNTTLNHVIYNDDSVCIKSQAALILLNNALRELDQDFLNKQTDLKTYLDNRVLYLIKQKRMHDELSCHYCGKTNLEIGFRHPKYSYLNNKNKKLATIDHIIPMSSGLVNLLDESNWVVSCKKCNSRKGSQSYEEFIKNKK